MSTKPAVEMPGSFFGAKLHEYTGGRYLFNEQLRLKERHLQFNVHELAKAICTALGKPFEELRTLEKFAEGGFNRMLQARFADGQEVLARLPYRIEAPLRRSVASEAATLSFLHQSGIPVPKVLDYSPTSDNPVGIEYILLEKLQGQPVGDRWFSLDNRGVTKVMKQIVDLEQTYSSIKFPASGSLYFRHDLLSDEQYVPISSRDQEKSSFMVGPIASYAWEYRERAALNVDRGPWYDFRSCFEAVAEREIAYCQEYEKPRHNVERYLRELDNLELQMPSHHIELLKDYLAMAPHLDIAADSPLARPTLRHPDLSPNNILVNDDNEITGIIDWQHTVTLPLCLCAGIPQYYQNWGDPVSESLQKPNTKFPPDFESLSPMEKDSARETMRRQLVHFYYAALTMKKAEAPFDAFRNKNTMLRAKLYSRAGAPWEGSSLPLEHALVEAQQNWPLSIDGSTTPLSNECPVHYPSERIETCLKRFEAAEEKLEELEDMRGMLGTDSIGWVQDDDHLAQAQEMRETMRTAFLKECETEIERIAVQDHFAFDDDEEE